MLNATKKILNDVKAHLIEKNIRPVIKISRHFEDRLVERFNAMVESFDEQELTRFERTVEKAMEKLPVSNVAQEYVHPAYGICIVAKKLGVNYLELVTCYKKEPTC
ncbi:hypothetical protein [Sulfurimonas indica]|uniref:hypothetical protein n=1 Tax=Sulfurimonas TaxID=202746 RepID=UPI001264EC17|nr:hypothetical protein [Sulfurimonas indica]